MQGGVMLFWIPWLGKPQWLEERYEGSPFADDDRAGWKASTLSSPSEPLASSTPGSSNSDSIIWIKLKIQALCCLLHCLHSTLKGQTEIAFSFAEDAIEAQRGQKPDKVILPGSGRIGIWLLISWFQPLSSFNFNGLSLPGVSQLSSCWSFRALVVKTSTSNPSLALR